MSVVAEHSFERCEFCGGMVEEIEIPGNPAVVRLPIGCSQKSLCAKGRVTVAALEESTGRVLSSQASGKVPPRPLHQCAALNCDKEDVPHGRDWCRRHYGLLPDSLRSKLNHARGPERQRLLNEAKDAIAEKEFGRRLL